MAGNKRFDYWPIVLDKNWTIGQIAGMEHTLIEQIEDYCAQAGISPSTLGVRALGNSRFLDRLNRKIEKFEEDAIKLRSFMASNPPTKKQEATQ